LKVLLDQGLPRSTADLLRSWGLDCVHTGEVGLSKAKDEEILLRARTENRVVVTLDADFHRLLALTGSSQPSVVSLRTQGLKGGELANLLRGLLERCEAALDAGALLSVRGHHVRIRKLPLRPGPS
jgi:predicted nuclease of predicted toxin-antitoxin system